MLFMYPREGNIYQFPHICAPPNRDQTCNLGMCPAQKLNPQPLDAQNNALTNWATLAKEKIYIPIYKIHQPFFLFSLELISTVYYLWEALRLVRFSVTVCLSSLHTTTVLNISFQKLLLSVSNMDCSKVLEISKHTSWTGVWLLNMTISH